MESELVTIPNELRLIKGDVHGNLDDFLERIYPEISNACVKPEMFAERAILTPRNEDINLINSKLIGRFCGDVYSYKRFDTVMDDHCNIYTTKLFNTLLPGGMSPHKLVLKLNNPVILLQNRDPSSGLCNGTKLIYRKLMLNLIQC